MLPTDFVSQNCIVDKSDCTLENKCNDCKKEIEDLKSIDKMFSLMISHTIDSEE